MRNKLIRYLYFLIGVAINSFGVALITKAALGTSPISSLPYVLSLQFAPTLGEFTFVVNLLFIATQIVLLRKNFEKIQYLQVAVDLVFSAVIDASMSLLALFQPETLLLKLISLVLGCAVLGFGISVEVAPDVLLVPGEGVVRALAAASGKRFGSVKVMFDVALVATAVVLSFLFFGRLNGIGVGTVISALAVGRFVNLFNRSLPLIPYIRSFAPQRAA